MTTPVLAELFAGEIAPLGRSMAVLRLTCPESAEQPRRHDVLALDCSWSMRHSLELVKAQACEFIESLSETDYVSVVIFSGHHSAKRLGGPVLCDRAGKQSLTQAVRNNAHVLNTTVFSEPLALVLEHLRQANTAGMQSQVILFTDGRAVPTEWALNLEQGMALVEARNLANFDASLSVIGYGTDYDVDFMERLIQANYRSGIYRHMATVEDFAEVIRDIDATWRRTDNRPVVVEMITSAGAIVRTLRAVPQVSSLYDAGHYTWQTWGLYDGSLTLFVELTNPIDGMLVQAKIGEAAFDERLTAQPLTPELEAECVRVMAAWAALSGSMAEAVELLQKLQDDGLAEAVGEAHTEGEKRVARDLMRRYGRRTRLGAGLKASGPNRCIANLLDVLQRDPAVMISFPDTGYNRGGVLMSDPRVIEQPARGPLVVTSVLSQKERLNLSFRALKTVWVRPVDDDGQIITDAKPIETKVYRTYNIIRDGELVLPELLVSMSDQSFGLLQVAGFIDAQETYSPQRTYRVVLAGVKMVSSAWARPASMRLVDLLSEVAELDAEQKALHARIKELGKPETPEFEGNVYREHSAAADAPVETYLTPCVEVRLMKYKAQDYAAQVADFSFEKADARLKEVRKRLEVVRFMARLITIACHLTGWRSMEWGAAKTNHHGKQERLGKLHGAQLKLVTWTKEVACS